MASKSASADLIAVSIPPPSVIKVPVRSWVRVVLNSDSKFLTSDTIVFLEFLGTFDVFEALEVMS